MLKTLSCLLLWEMQNIKTMLGVDVDIIEIVIEKKYLMFKFMKKYGKIRIPVYFLFLMFYFLKIHQNPSLILLDQTY